jgi:hypothetical protein
MSELAGTQFVTLDIESAQGGCMRSYLLSQVDAVLNEGAIREAAEATAALQSPEVLRDTEASPYVTKQVSFTDLKAPCGTCGEEVRVGYSGVVAAEGCAVSGFCEWQVANRLGKSGYAPPPAEEPNEQPVECAGYGCRARVALWRTTVGEDMTAEMVSGDCAVDLLRRGWIARMGVTIKKEKLDAPDPDRMQTDDYEDINNPRYQGEV